MFIRDNLNLLVVLFIVGLFFLRFTSQVQATTVHSGHPRIILSAIKKTQLIQDCSSGGVLREQYLAVKNWVDTNPSHSGSTFAVDRYWLSVYLVAMVDGGLYLTTAETHIRGDDWNQYSDTNVLSASIGYDWLYDIISESVKQEYANEIKAWWDYHNSTSAYFHSSWNNHTMEEVHGFIFGSLALYNDGYYDTDANLNLSVAYNWLYNELIPATNQFADGEIDGGWSEGTEYWGRGGYAFLMSCLAWSSATDENALNEAKALSGMGHWAQAIIQNNNQYATIGDIERGSGGTSYTEDLIGAVEMYILADVYNDGYARKRWNDAIGNGDGNMNGSEQAGDYRSIYLYYILFNNNVIPQTIGQHIYFDKAGLVVDDGGGNISNNYFLYKHNHLAAGHDHLDAGTFNISRDVGLIIDGGAYEGGDVTTYNHAWQYYHRTIAANVLTVFDPNEVWLGEDWDSNDGGQQWCSTAYNNATGNTNCHPKRYGDITEDSCYWRGKINKHFYNDGITTINSNLTSAYSSDKLKFYERNWIIFDNEFFVLFDKVETQNSSFKKRLLFHFVNEPIINNEEIIIDNGNSRAIINILLPTSTDITKRGGSGEEYLNSYPGVNVPIRSSSWGDYPNEPGIYRIEISPTQNNLQDKFLEVIYAGDKSINMPIINKINGNNEEGVIINGDKVAIFADNINVNNVDSISYVVNLFNPSKHVVIGLNDGSYIVYVNGEIFDNNLSVNNGTLVFSLASIGNQSIAIIKNEVIIRADVDQNSSINSTDALLTLRNSLGLDMSNTNWQSSATTGDVNCDGNSNSTDAMLILRYSLGLSMEGTGWCE
jgi:hypothetical protein